MPGLSLSEITAVCWKSGSDKFDKLQNKEISYFKILTGADVFLK